MSDKTSIFSFHILGVEMKIINLSPDSLIDFFIWIVVLYACVRLINLIVRYLEKTLKLDSMNTRKWWHDNENFKNYTWRI